jgi:hypothetical protein
MVGYTRLELVTSPLSGVRSTTELIAHRSWALLPLASSVRDEGGLSGAYNQEYSTLWRFCKWVTARASQAGPWRVVAGRNHPRGSPFAISDPSVLLKRKVTRKMDDENLLHLPTYLPPIRRSVVGMFCVNL